MRCRDQPAPLEDNAQSELLVAGCVDEAFHAAVSGNEVQEYALVSGLQGYSPDLRFPSTSGVKHQESSPGKRVLTPHLRQFALCVFSCLFATSSPVCDNINEDLQ